MNIFDRIEEAARSPKPWREAERRSIRRDAAVIERFRSVCRECPEHRAQRNGTLRCNLCGCGDPAAKRSHCPAFRWGDDETTRAMGAETGTARSTPGQAPTPDQPLHRRSREGSEESPDAKSPGKALFIVNGGLGDAVAITYALVAARDAGYEVDVWAMRGNATRMIDIWNRMRCIRPVTREEARRGQYEAVLCPTRRSVLERRAQGIRAKRLVSPSRWGGRIVDHCMRLVQELAGDKRIAAPEAPLGELIDDSPRKLVLVGPGVGPRPEARAKKWDKWRELLGYLPRPVAVIGDTNAQEDWIDEAAKEKDVESLVGRTKSILDLLPLMGQARIYFGVDNGLGHLAAACGVQTVTIFSSTNPRRYLPGRNGSAAVSADSPVGDVANVVHRLELARRGMKPPRAKTWSGKLSIVITSHNEGEEVRQTILDAKENAGCEVEFVVVDDASTDGSCDRLPKGVKVVRQRQKTGVALSRNLGVAHATGDALMFLDAHMRVAPGSPALMAKEAANRGAVIVPGVAALYSARTHANYISRLDMKGGGGGRLQSKWNGRVPRDRFTPTPSFVAPGWVVSRQAWERIGPWPLTLSNWGSTEVCKSVQAYLACVPVVACRDAIVWHRFRSRFPYKVSTHGVWQNAYALARACFDEAAWRGFFEPTMRRRYWKSPFEEVIDGPLGTQERAAFALRRRRLGEDFVREVLGEDPEYNDPFTAEIDRRLGWLESRRIPLLKKPGTSERQTQDETEMRAWLHCLKCLDPSRVVEVGTFRMAHLYMMAACVRPGGTLVAVDSSDEARDAREAVASQLRAEGFNVGFVQGNSHSGATVAKARDALGGSLADAVYIDADHSYASVKRDHAAYSGLVRSGGAVAFHDIGQRPPEVRRYWEEIRRGVHGDFRWSEIVSEGWRRPTGVGAVFL